MKNRRRREEPTKGEKGEKERRRERRRVAGTHSCSDSCYRVIEWRPPDCTRYALPARWNHLAQSVLFYPWEFAGPLYIHTYAIRVPDTSGRSATDVNGGSIRTDLERRKPRLGRCTHSHQIKPDLHSVNKESPRGCPLGCNNGHTVVYRTVSPPLFSFGFPSFGRREREEKNRIDENEAKFHTEGRQRLGRGACRSRRRLEKSHGDMAEVKETDWWLESRRVGSFEVR